MDNLVYLLALIQTMLALIEEGTLKPHDMGILVGMSEGYTQNEIALRMGHDQPWVSERESTIRHELEKRGFDWVHTDAEGDEGTVIEV